MNWLMGNISDITDEQYAEIYEGLSKSRKAHIDKKEIKEAKKASLLATHLLNELLLKEFNINSPIETDENGVPFVKDDIFISISHSKEKVVCAASLSPIGIDIEKIRPVKENLINFVCTPEEKAFVLENDKGNRFFMVWTAKEAAFKKEPKRKSLLLIDTLDLKKETFIIDGYCISIV
ncbi:MAG: 4'-phosphopantetheinyl transferase superfamily protein [Ruminococcaceae bacterium]|nr:4'-phosphopantetheinyl transferase superfamily protein [Oscillospiraceae bacterium]